MRPKFLATIQERQLDEHRTANHLGAGIWSTAHSPLPPCDDGTSLDDQLHGAGYSLAGRLGDDGSTLHGEIWESDASRIVVL